MDDIKIPMINGNMEQIGCNDADNGNDTMDLTSSRDTQ